MTTEEVANHSGDTRFFACGFTRVLYDGCRQSDVNSRNEYSARKGRFQEGKKEPEYFLLTRREEKNFLVFSEFKENEKELKELVQKKKL
jgi:hypothetical protein